MADQTKDANDQATTARASRPVAESVGQLLQLQRLAGNAAVGAALRKGPAIHAGAPGSVPGEVITPGVVLQLQRLVGNTAVSRLITQSPTAVAVPVQRAGKAGEVDELDQPGNVRTLDHTRVPTRGNIAFEAAKPAGVIGGAAGGALGSGNFGIGSGIIGGAGLIDAGMTIHGGYSRRQAALAGRDLAGVSVGEGKMRSGGWGASGAAMGTTQAGLNIGKAAGSSLVTVGALGGLSVAGGGVMVLQGLWRMYKAAGKLSGLARRAMFTAAGERWKARVGNREKWKLGVGALKVALGALGIAAGALVIASNPVGWALGIAAAVAGGAWAITKIVGKIKDLWDRRKAKKEIAKRDPDGSKRKTAKALADAVVVECSTNARVAGEMVGALGTGRPGIAAAYLAAIDRMDATVGKATSPADFVKPSEDDKKAHDSFSLLGVLNIPPEEALSQSGQERIEKKLSVAESA
ncbi:MAG TPA: hypothetical protein VG184_00475 [Acidimicrobiales bacterium]|nr:hypothetical protein [Acidimicrobiales bacterium]